MPRKPRESVEGGAYHVYARGVAKQAIYRDNRDGQTYLRMLANVVRSQQWTCLSYCLMNNHVHLLIETPAGDLSAGVQRLHGGYAQAFNRRHDRIGHLFQGRFGAVRIKSDAQMCTTAAYIARNPVEAGLCPRPDDWPWSSYRATIQALAPPWLASGRLLSYFSSQPDAAREQFARATSQMPTPYLKGSDPLTESEEESG